MRRLIGLAVIGGLIVVPATCGINTQQVAGPLAPDPCTAQTPATVNVANADPSAAQYVKGFTGKQIANASTIVSVAKGLGLPPYAWQLGVQAAIGESSLMSIGYGDSAGPDSRGLFQQRDGWGPLATRMDPAGSATLFYSVNKGPGVRGLKWVPGWQSMKSSAAIHAVQHNADPNYYTAFEDEAKKIVERIAPGSTPLLAPSVNTAVNTNVDTARNPQCATVQNAAQVTRQGGVVPPGGTEAGRKAVAWTLAHLGLWYGWGANGPDRYDCSSFTKTAWASAGVTIPRTAREQLAFITRIPAGTEQPGDLAFPKSHLTGHVVMVVGPLGGGKFRYSSERHTGTVSNVQDGSEGSYVFGRVPQ